MSIVIFDTEYTSWKGCQEFGWKNGQKKEVVQLSAIKINENLEVIGEFSVYVKPKINPVLSDYFINLTGITNEMITEKGISLSDAYALFSQFVDNDVCWSHGWGSPLENISDGQIINDNLQLIGIHPKNIKYYNIAAFFAEMYKKYNIDIKSQSSGMIATLLGRDKNLKNLGLATHNALYDVYSILEGIKNFREDAKMLFEI